jgi:hypothetical protein
LFDIAIGIGIGMSIALIVGVAGLGLCAIRTRETALATWFEALSHGLGSLGLLIGLFSFVPRYKAIFEGFEVKVSAVTLLVFDCSNLVVNFWWGLVPFVGGLIYADAVIFRDWHRNPLTRPQAKIWSGVITGIVTLTILVLCYNLASSVLEILEKLS